MYRRNCPQCNKVLSYTRKDSLDRAIKNNKTCFDCVYDIPVDQRFWLKVDRSKDCWNWTASKVGKGYGGFTDKRHRRKHIVAHRFAWESCNGPIPDGLFVCHKCDNMLCVNPTHLFLGTQSDNIKDCFRKQRDNRTRDYHGRFI